MIDECGADAEFDAEEVAGDMPDTPNTWSDRSRIQDPVNGIELAGALFSCCNEPSRLS